MTLNKVEQEKLIFLKTQGQKKEEGPSYNLHLKILGLYLTLKIYHLDQEHKSFLKTYLSPYLIKEHSKPEITIDYIYFRDDRQDLSHRWWSQRIPLVHHIPFDGTTALIERDLIGIIDCDRTFFRLWGPAISPSNTDSLDNLLTRVMSNCLEQTKTFILHACCVVKDDRAYVFFGESGAGKSTLAQYCLSRWGLPLISSDQCYLSVQNNKVMAQTTPITLPELKRDDPLRQWKPTEVAALIHLRRHGQRGAFPKALPDFYRELLGQSLPYLSPGQNTQHLLDILNEVVSTQNLIKGELSYQLEDDIWRYLNSLELC